MEPWLKVEKSVENLKFSGRKKCLFTAVPGTTASESRLLCLYGISFFRYFSHNYCR